VLFSKLGVDVIFTKHFKEQVNSWREERKPITYEELENLFMKAYRNAGQIISELPDNTSVVLRDHWSRLNSPIKVNDTQMDRKLIMKTIKRQQRFLSSNPIINI
jgi:hypothetical protein